MRGEQAYSKDHELALALSSTRQSLFLIKQENGQISQDLARSVCSLVKTLLAAERYGEIEDLLNVCLPLSQSDIRRYFLELADELLEHANQIRFSDAARLYQSSPYIWQYLKIRKKLTGLDSSLIENAVIWLFWTASLSLPRCSKAELERFGYIFKEIIREAEKQLESSDKLLAASFSIVKEKIEQLAVDEKPIKPAVCLQIDVDGFPNKADLERLVTQSRKHKNLSPQLLARNFAGNQKQPISLRLTIENQTDSDIIVFEALNEKIQTIKTANITFLDSERTLKQLKEFWHELQTTSKAPKPIFQKRANKVESPNSQAQKEDQGQQKQEGEVESVTRSDYGNNSSELHGTLAFISPTAILQMFSLCGKSGCLSYFKPGSSKASLSIYFNKGRLLAAFRNDQEYNLDSGVKEKQDKLESGREAVLYFLLQSMGTFRFEESKAPDLSTSQYELPTVQSIILEGAALLDQSAYIQARGLDLSKPLAVLIDCQNKEDLVRRLSSCGLSASEKDDAALLYTQLKKGGTIASVSTLSELEKLRLTYFLAREGLI